MIVSKNGLDLIKEFESFRAKPYLCPSQKATIGFGSTYYPDGKKVTLQDKEITEEKAFEILEYIANKDFGSNINKVVKVPLSQNQFDALVSFAYNLGSVNFRNSTLLKKINLKDFDGASNEFPKWTRAGGKVLRGLATRRNKERDLFLKAEQRGG